MTLSIASGGPRRILLLKYGVKYPDGSGKILTKPAAEVTVFDERLRQLIADMFHTMYKMQGVGLAATQIGLGMRIAVVDITSGRDPAGKIVLVNPDLVETGADCQVEWEGCLSLPGFREKVSRPEDCRVRAQNERGEWHEVLATGLLARALQHEIGHLDGELYIDCISRLRKSLIEGKIKKLKRQGRW